MDINKKLLSSFTIKKQFIENGEWERLSSCLHGCLMSLYKYGVLTAKPIEVTAGYRPAEDDTERFEVEMVFDEHPNDRHLLRN